MQQGSVGSVALESTWIDWRTSVCHVQRAQPRLPDLLASFLVPVQWAQEKHSMDPV